MGYFPAQLVAAGEAAGAQAAITLAAVDTHQFTTFQQVQDALLAANSGTASEREETFVLFANFWGVTDNVGVAIGSRNAAVFTWIREHNQLGELTLRYSGSPPPRPPPPGRTRSLTHHVCSSSVDAVEYGLAVGVGSDPKPLGAYAGAMAGQVLGACAACALTPCPCAQRCHCAPSPLARWYTQTVETHARCPWMTSRACASA